jgi:hypothetical protein
MGIAVSAASIEQLVGGAPDCSSKARSTFLDACSNAAELSQLVEELFLADQRAGSFLEGGNPISASASDISPVLVPDGSSWRATPAFGNDEYDWSCLFAGPILHVVPNRVLIVVANGIETNYHRLDIVSLEYQIRIRIGRVGALEPYFKLWIMMAFGSPLEGTALLGMVRKRAIGIGNCDDCTQRPVKLTLGCHSSARSLGEIMLLESRKIHSRWRNSIVSLAKLIAQMWAVGNYPAPSVSLIFTRRQQSPNCKRILNLGGLFWFRNDPSWKFPNPGSS